jgi:ERCC4-type nuclease
MVTAQTPLKHDGETYAPGEEVDMIGEEARENGLVAIGAVEIVASLPDDFPGRDAFHEAGITSVDDVAALAEEDELQSVEGIGDKTEQRVRTALADEEA